MKSVRIVDATLRQSDNILRNKRRNRAGVIGEAQSVTFERLLRLLPRLRDQMSCPAKMGRLACAAPVKGLFLVVALRLLLLLNDMPRRLWRLITRTNFIVLVGLFRQMKPSIGHPEQRALAFSISHSFSDVATFSSTQAVHFELAGTPHHPNSYF